MKVTRQRKRFVGKELSYDNGSILVSHMFILLKGKSFDVEDTLYTAFFRHKDILNLSMETKKKTYARYIVPFLNYIFFDSKDNIKKIEDLTLELCDKYMNDYADGILDGTMEKKSKDTIEKGEVALTKFIKWLYANPKIKMKYFKRKMFEDKSIFSVSKTKKRKRERLETLTSYMVLELIKTAQEHDSMMAFAIGLQAFVGLRAGDICQMSFDRFNFTETSWDRFNITDPELRDEIDNSKYKELGLSGYIDLQEEYSLRSDGVRTSGIKIHRIQPVFEGFLPMVKVLYYQHQELLKHREFNNKYNAVFLNKNGTAMTEASYFQRFRSLVLKLTEKITYLSKVNPLALEANILLEGAPMGTHSLRYYYTNSLGPFIQSPHMLAFYRGDSNINSAIKYLKNTKFTKDYIKEVQDSFADTLKELKALKDMVV